MRARISLLVVFCMLLACRSTNPFPTPTPTRQRPTPTLPASGLTSEPTVQVRTPEGTPPLAPPPPQVILNPLRTNELGDFARPDLHNWQKQPYEGPVVELPVDLEQTLNPAVISGLTTAQQEFLAKNGFVVIHSREAQFHGIRQRVSRFYGQPYFLTTDAAYHALHLTFDDLLKALEREELRPAMVDIVRSTLDEVLSYQSYFQGTELEADARLAAAYLSVALRLFDPNAPVDAAVQEGVEAQLKQIEAGGGRAPSVLIPEFEDDYGAYKPVGHYAGDPLLENYFRGMTWLGRVHFGLEQTPGGPPPSRAPLLITLAMRRVAVDSVTAADLWVDVHETLAFLIGPSDDSGPAEYAALMDQVYGTSPSLLDLVQANRWQDFQRLAAELPPPRINSTFVDSLADLEKARGWRMMGQRFTMDNLVLQNLVFDKVGTQENPRKLPSGLDVMVALGSTAAQEALEEAGETRYENYSEQLELLQGLIQRQSEAEWLDTAFSAWLYAFFPQLEPKGEDYPSFMRTAAWAYKELNSALSSWAELKHDTALYAKMPEFAGGGGPPSSGPAPAYVEPNPDVFYRLAFVAQAYVDGLELRLMAGEESRDPQSLYELVQGMRDLAQRFKELGDIARRELAGEALTEDDYYLIQSPLGPNEDRVIYMQDMARFGVGPGDEMPPVPVIAAVAGAEDQILQVGVGLLDRIYVVVMLEEELQIAQGGVLAYYEFPGPRAERLTDEAWRARLDGSPPAPPAWAGRFRLNEGNPVDILAFRVGDYYKITEAGADLNVRSEPSRSGNILYKLQPEDYIQIVDGPVQANGFTWWKVLDEYSGQPAGWAVEHQQWYERAWGQ